MVSLMSWGGYLLCRETLAPPWHQLLRAAGSARVILGEERQESQQFRRLAGGVCAWCVLLGSSGEKDPCDTGFSAGASSETDLHGSGCASIFPGPPQTCGMWVMRHSHPISASNTVLSPGGITCDPKASPQHTAPANTPWQGRKTKTPKQERI